MGKYIVSFSPTDTTTKVLSKIAKGMGGSFELIDVTLKKERNKTLFFTQEDIVLIGAPVYAGRLPFLVETYFQTIKGDGAKAIPVVLYGNRHFDDALLQLDDILRSNNFKTLAGAAFIGEHSYTKEVAANRPDTKDLQIAFEFGIKIELENQIQSLPGNRPYRPLQQSAPIAPSTSSACTMCGACLNFCPADAISKDNFKSDELLCIKCHACVKKCPNKAKYFDERLDPVRRRLIDNFSERREPELFY